MKLLLFAVCIAAVVYSCGKTNPVIAPGSGISATVDGVNENFDAIDSAGYVNRTGYYSMYVTGRSGAADSADVIKLYISSPTPIATGVYTLSTTSNTAPFYPLIILMPKRSHNFANDYVVDYTGAHPVMVTITTLTSTKVAGTFSGTLVVAAGTSGATRTITNGMFNLGFN